MEPMHLDPKLYDVIVIGAGHAGIEAASAAARLGTETLMLTQNLDSVGQMSCNPAIGGQAKGQIVREIDALGGVMALNADATAIQFKMLNAGKGPSVRSPRAQCDKKAYQFRAKAILERTDHLTLKQGNVIRLRTDETWKIVETDLGIAFAGKTVVITTGTFMRGLLHVGMHQKPGGRMGDGISTLSDSLRELGLELRRFKTGTPCRIAGRSIDFGQCQRQDGDEPPVRFSFATESLVAQRDDIFTLNRWEAGAFHVEQLPCWITATNPNTHQLIRANLDKSPLYAGRIEGTGPRYCPSIEDKVVKFAAKERHQLFLEPEGRHTDEYYVNGVSTSLPYEVQYAFIRTIRGLHRAEIMRAGYAVEYDYCPPTQLTHQLESKSLPGVFFAGQINGTSGYEEAAAQGLIAGANAALKILGRPALTLSRADAYIGVLIDDLVTQGTSEPYRMFTSRAEHRLILRHDNADLRLTPIAHRHGLVSSERWEKVSRKIHGLNDLRIFADASTRDGIRLAHWLKRPENSFSQIPAAERERFPAELWEQLETDLKYAGYIARQHSVIQRLRSEDDKRIPATLDYALVRGLRTETRQKLAEVRPETLGQAARISGVTPADVALLSIVLQKPGALA